jgi:hypothetical protein
MRQHVEEERRRKEDGGRREGQMAREPLLWGDFRAQNPL